MSDPLDLDAIESWIRDIVSCADEADGGKADAEAYARQLVTVARAPLLAEVDALRWDLHAWRKWAFLKLAETLRPLAAQTALEALIATWRAENPTSMAGIYATGYEDALRRCADDLEHVAAQTAPQKDTNAH
jgi:hypothetical protein